MTLLPDMVQARWPEVNVTLTLAEPNVEMD